MSETELQLDPDRFIWPGETFNKRYNTKTTRQGHNITINDKILSTTQNKNRSKLEVETQQTYLGYSTSSRHEYAKPMRTPVKIANRITLACIKSYYIQKTQTIHEQGKKKHNGRNKNRKGKS